MAQGGAVHRLIMVALVATAWLGAAPRVRAQSPTYVAVRTDDGVRDKAFYLFSLLEHDAAARAALADDPTLTAIGARSRAAIAEALIDCPKASDCLLKAAPLSQPDIDAAGQILGRMAAPGGPLSKLVRRHMRPSGYFQRYADREDQALMVAAWAETAAGLNRLYAVYGLGQPPRYPVIDAMIFTPDSRTFVGVLRHAADIALNGADQPVTFLDAWSRIGLDLLMINQRQDARQFEPMVIGENHAASKRARTLAWRRFQYVAILVPGAGLETEERGLSGAGALRLRLAVKHYRQGLAPFILVSGGNVHPNRTPDNEAIEMKRELMASYGVPDTAILIDPHARHTTTNLRNAARLLFRLNAPTGAPVLITTTRDQSGYIESTAFSDRCKAELGYTPFQALARLSPFDLTAILPVVSLHADPVDPLDP